MLVKKIILKSALLFLFTSQGFGITENSILPLVDKFEILENLPIKKYSDSQYSEISHALMQTQEKIRIVSYNVLFNIRDHEMEKINRWKFRYPRVVELIDKMQPDIICVQELYKKQLEDLRPYLDKEFAFFAKSNDEGELNGIFYRKARFKLEDCHVWYMTKMPEVPSLETLTMVKLKDLKTDKEFAVFNTHLAFSKINKRDFQARFIADTLASIEKGTPVILTGDFNTFPNRLDLEKLPALDGDYINRILTNGCLREAKEMSILGHVGPTSTFTNNPESTTPFNGTGTPGVYLDHIYVTKEIGVLIHAVEPATVNGYFPSDHMPILIDFYIQE